MTTRPAEAAAHHPAALVSGVEVAPSILAANFARLGAQVEEVLEAGARVIHVDVMDGHFVPPITMGPLVVAALRESTSAAGALLDVHLMIERPERQVAEFARAGADVISFHIEATSHAHHALATVRDAGCRAGLALTPATPPAALAEVAADLDVVVCMTVNPGWGGQRFIPASLDKIARLAALVPRHVTIEVDGGIDAGTAEPVVAAGARLLVAGSAVFGAAEPGAAFARLAAVARGRQE